MIECNSLLGPYIQGFLSYREALFHKNSAHEPIMKSLDRFCAKRFPFSAVLTREMVLTWMEDSSGFKICVTQPLGDQRQIHSMLVQVHSPAVAKMVWM